MKIYGYIRVSAGNQNEDRQLIAMKNAQVPRNNIFLDKQSGCNFDRPMYRKKVYVFSGRFTICLFVIL